MSLRHSLLVKNTRRAFGRFLKDSSATVTQIFGLSAIPIFLAAGAAIDGARIHDEQTKFLAAVDAAVIAVASDDRAAVQSLSGGQLEARMAELENIAADYIDKNYDASGDISVNLEISGQTVKLDADFVFPTTIMSLVGISEVDMQASSTVKKAMRPIELVMVMDTTGSMDTGGKMEGAKTAARNLMTTLYGGSLGSEPRSEFLRTALVPFSGAVRLDQAAHDFNLNWIDTTGANPLSRVHFDDASAPAVWNNYYAWSRLKSSSSAFHSWNGCVETRMRGTGSSAYHTNDAAPNTSQPNSLFPAFFNPDVPGTTSSSDTTTSYGQSYLAQGSNTTAYTECYGTGWSSTSCSSTSNARVKQENYRKYDGANIGSESESNYGPWSMCAVSKVVPMTYDRAKVEAGIDAMNAYGPTMIGEGLSWGWRAISPGEPFTKVEGSGSLPNTTIAPYGDARWQKIIVLMTDGDNDLSYGGSWKTMNGTAYSAYGFSGEGMTYNRFGNTSASSSETVLDNDMLSICSNVKAAGITLYVASFGSGVSTSTRDRLQTCSSGTGYYQHANAPSDLAAFFNHIGQDVINKSIYVSK